TLAGYAGVGHGASNAIMLPHTIGALAGRSPDRLRGLTGALGCDPSVVAAHLRRLGGVERLSDAGVTPGALETCIEKASKRPQLQLTPPPADVIELRELYQAAY
ncbi:MAG TPA: hypothetical protein VIX82_05495, partial [Solirubrobacteraceae bacterium]